MALDFVAGCLGGCAGVAVGHPLDTVKVLIQTQDFSNPKYRGTWHCLTHTIKHESIRGLYKGMSSPMAGVAFVNAIIFGVHGNMSKRMEDPDALRSQVICGAAAGFFQSFVASPIELVKTRMQIQTESVNAAKTTTTSTPTSYTNPLQCLKRIIRTEGLRGLYRGQLVTIMRDVPGFASYFLTYEYLTRSFMSDDGFVSPGVVLMAGGSAGAASWLFSYPMDVVKSRLQADGTGDARKYKGMLHCVKSTIASDGVGAFFRGLNSSLIRAFPTNAATFAVVTWTMQMFQAADIEDGLQYRWNEVLSRGEALVDAAAIPTIQLALSQQSHWQTVASCLPQVIACSDIETEEELEEEEEEEEHSSYFQRNCSCMKARLGSLSMFGRIPRFLGAVYARHDGYESKTLHERLCDVLACSRPCIWALTKHQHNLSIVL